MDFVNQIICGDCEDVLKRWPDDAVDLIFTSPPYADRRATTYGGVKPGDYVDWFLPKTEQFLRVLKPTGTFVLNIKERTVNGERHTYVIELILKMRERGWLWTEEFMWQKKIPIRENGPIAFEIRGKDFCSLTNTENFGCTKRPLWCPSGNGQRSG